MLTIQCIKIKLFFLALVDFKEKICGFEVKKIQFVDVFYYLQLSQASARQPTKFSRFQSIDENLDYLVRVVPTVLQKRQMPQDPTRFIKFKGSYFSNIISLMDRLVIYCDFVSEFMFLSYNFPYIYKGYLVRVCSFWLFYLFLYLTFAHFQFYSVTNWFSFFYKFLSYQCGLN